MPGGYTTEEVVLTLALLIVLKLFLVPPTNPN